MRSGRVVPGRRAPSSAEAALHLADNTLPRGYPTQRKIVICGERELCEHGIAIRGLTSANVGSRSDDG